MEDAGGSFAWHVCIRACATLIDVGAAEVDIARPQGPFATTRRRRKYTLSLNQSGSIGNAFAAHEMPAGSPTGTISEPND